MRYLTDMPRPSWKILDDVSAELGKEATRASYLGLRHATPERGEMTPNGGTIANMVLARFLRMPREERDRLLREGAEEVARHLERDEMVDFAQDWPINSGAEALPDPAVVVPPGGSASSVGSRRKDGPGKRKRVRKNLGRAAKY